MSGAPAGLIGIATAYLIGGIPFGLLIVRIMTGRDVRAAGSGNIGATNVLRTTGRLAGVLTLLLDAAKGWFAVWLAARLTGQAIGWTSAAAFAVLAGHAFPAWLRFKGGRAVASFFGAYLYLAPLPILAGVLLFIFVVASTRHLSLGSIIGVGFFPLACWIILHPPWPLLLSGLASACLVIYRHADNIRRIRAGNERVFRFGRTER